MAYRAVPPSRQVGNAGRPTTPITHSGGTAPHIYVSPTGSDSTGDGTINRPYATPAWAQAIARVAYVGTPVIEIRAGRYYNTSLTLGLEDAGMTYKSTDGPGQAVLIGGRPVTGWERYSGNIWRAPIQAPVWTIYESGTRATQARLPKKAPGASYPCAFAPYFTTAGVDSSNRVVQYNPVDFNPASWTLSDIRLFIWSKLGAVQIAWFTDIHALASRNTGASTLTTDQDMKFLAYHLSGGARYVVQGPLELLTEAGEFTCTGGYVYYWPRNTPFDPTTVIIPSTKNVMSLYRASNVTIDGLGIEGTDFDSWYRWGNDGLTVEYEYFKTMLQFQKGGIYVEDSSGVTITNCHLKNIGFSGVFLQNACSTCTVSKNWIEHVGGEGISVNGIPPGLGNLSTGNTLTNNKIQNYGELDGSANGIRLSQSSSNTISYSNILNGPNRGIWLHGDYNVPAANNYCRSNVIDHVKIQNVVQDSGDRGAISVSFLSSPPGGGSQVPVNSMDQVIIDGATAHSSMTDVAPNALFYDNHASGQSASNVNATNIQGTVQRYNDADGATFTNVSWLGGFNPAGMDTANIGVTATFPY